MSIGSIKKVLLAGTALVAAAAFSAPAQAATATLTTNTTWASAGTHTSSPADGTAAAQGDNVNTNGNVLVVTNNQTANDGEGFNTFTIGTISGTGTTDGFSVAPSSANDIAVTIGSINETGANAGIAISNVNPGTSTATNNTTVNVLGNFVTGGLVGVINGATGVPATTVLTVNGDMTVNGGVVGIQAGTAPGAYAELALKGAGVNALSAVLLGDGAVNNPTSTGRAVLYIGGTAAQTITGTIDGGQAGEGSLVVANPSGNVTFSNAIGSVASIRDVEAGRDGTTTTFNAPVNAGTLMITGTGTVAFGAQNFTGNIQFGGNFLGSDFGSNNGTVTLSSGDIVGNVDTAHAGTGTVTITGAGGIAGNVGSAAAGDTLLAVNIGTSGTSAITGPVFANAVNITGNGTVDFGGTLTGTLAYGANNGTVFMADGANIQGAVTATSTGTLTLGGTNTVSGNIGTLNVLNAGQVGGTSTLSGTVNASNINIGTGEADFAKAVTGAIDFGGHNGAVVLASGAGLTGTVDSTAAASGTLSFAGGTQNVSGAVGITHALSLVNAAESAGTTTFGGLVKAVTLTVGSGTAVLNGGFNGTTANFNDNGTLQLGAGQTLTGNVTATTDGTGTLAFAGSGTVTGAVNSTLHAITVGGTGTTATVTGNLIAANTTNVGGNTLAAGGTFTMAGGQTLDATITGVGTNGKVAATGTATIDHGAILNLTVDPAFHPAIGALAGTYSIVTGAGGGSVDSALTINSSPLYTFTQVANANSLQVTGVRNAITTVTTNSNNAAVGAALDTIGLTGNAALDAVQADVNAAPTAAALNNVLASLTPTVDGGAQASAMEVGAAVQDIADTRLEALRDDDGTTGYSAGASANGASLWIQGYGQSATQDTQNSIAGYTATTKGGVVGADASGVVEDAIIGAMFNYGQSSIDSKNVNTTKTTVDNYGFDLYGTGFLVQQMFLDWQAGYGHNKINSVRHDVGAAGIDATGDTTSTQYDARLALGKDYTVDYGTIFTPDVSMNYVHLSTAGYTETGSGANLNVSPNSQNQLDFGVGAKMSWLLRSYYGPIMKPTVHVGYSYAAVDSQIETTSTFAGAAPGTNPSFVTMGPTPARSRFDIGAGLAYWTMENWDLSANTNYEYRQDYHAYSGVLRATAHF